MCTSFSYFLFLGARTSLYKHSVLALILAYSLASTTEPLKHDAIIVTEEQWQDIAKHLKTDLLQLNHLATNIVPKYFP